MELEQDEHHNLEIYFQAKLENSRVTRGGDGPESRRSQYRIGRSQWWSISYVKCFNAKFDVAIFAEVGALY